MLPSTLAGTAITLVEISFSRKYSERETASERVWVAPTKTNPVSWRLLQSSAAFAFYSGDLSISWVLPQ
jgi:hypothetical protein